MNRVARLDPSRRAQLFRETADRMGLSEAVVEKDFWVCWTLNQIFTIEQFKERLLFKGGTSLSKVFGAIQRFSEDIDLAVDYTLLGFAGDRDPTQPDLSRTRQLKLQDEMLASCAAYIKTEFAEILQTRFSEILGAEGWAVSIDPVDPHQVRFHYPRVGAKRTLLHSAAGDSGTRYSRRIHSTRPLSDPLLRRQRVPKLVRGAGNRCHRVACETNFLGKGHDPSRRILSCRRQAAARAVFKALL